MKETTKERLNRLYQQYDLQPEDLFQSPQGWKIITRTGLDKIQSKANIFVNYDLVVADVVNKTYVVKAIGSFDDKTIETYGESSPDNTRQKYPVAMAEKRSLSRVVLKLTGFYELGVMSEDEADDFGKAAGQHRADIIRKKL